MKTPRMLSVGLALSVISVLFAPTALSDSALASPVRVGVGLEFTSVIAPEGGRLRGELADAYNCVIDGSGYQFDYVVLPLARLIHELRVGNLDMGLPLVHEPSRDQFATLGDAVIDSSYLRVSLPGNEVRPDGSGVRYVYVRGFAGKTILKDLRGLTIPVSQWEQAIEMLRRQRTDYVLITEKTFRAMTANSDEPFVVETVSDLEVAFYVNHSAPDLLNALNEANARCKS